MKEQNEIKTCWGMYDPTITTEHPELVSVERGSQVQYMWAFLTYESIVWTYAYNTSKINGNPQEDQSTKPCSKSPQNP
jgi:hypothetical protein